VVAAATAAPQVPEGAGGPAVPVSTTLPTVPPRGRARRWIVPAVVAVAVVVVFATLWAVAASHSSTSAGAVPFSDAASSATHLADRELGGSWGVLGTVGLDERTPAIVSTTNLSAFLGSNCSPEEWNGSPIPSHLTVPAYAGSFEAGVSPFWAVFLLGASADSFALVEVLNGSAIPYALIGGTGCGASSDHALPNGTADSPKVASTAWEADGESWVASDRNLTSFTMAAFGDGTFGGIAHSYGWGVVYSTCDPVLGGSSQEPAFVELLNLTTAAVTLAVPYHLDCPG
jgi:hypothetical protein